tara:strand:- start:9362 stop:9859 length:498 start_codon:yes stop_codon:yes gene_type:complete
MDLTPLKNIYNNQIDIILSQTGLTIPCSLVYETSKISDCPNCIYDTISKKSSNQYKSGGPLPFSNGQTCPFCLGSGTSSSSVAEDQVYFAVLTDSKNFIQVANSPNIEAQTICSISYLDQIKKCSKIIFNTDIPELTNNIFVRANEPTPVGLGDNKYIFTNWKRS